jgi:hypothetical protein
MTKLNHAEFYTLMRDYNNTRYRYDNFALSTNSIIYVKLTKIEDKIYTIFRDNSSYTTDDKIFLESFGLGYKIGEEKLYGFPHYKFYLNNKFVFERYDTSEQ